MIGFLQIDGPKVAGDYLGCITALGAAVAVRTFAAVVWIRDIKSISVSVGSLVSKYMILWADIAVMIFIVGVLVLFEVLFPSHRALVGQYRHYAVIKAVFCDRGVT